MTKKQKKPRMTYALFLSKLKKYRKMFEIQSGGRIRSKDVDAYCPIAYIMHKDYAKVLKADPIYAGRFGNSDADDACQIWSCSAKDMAERIVDAADKTTGDLKHGTGGFRKALPLRVKMLKALGLSESLPAEDVEEY
jgi:hypothetical protein